MRNSSSRAFVLRFLDKARDAPVLAALHDAKFGNLRSRCTGFVASVISAPERMCWCSSARKSIR